MALVDAESLDALTIRRLALDLGVTPMALYWHFRNKDELLDAVAEQVLALVRLPEPDTSGWDEQLRATLTAFADALRPHPAVAGLMVSRALSSRAGLTLTERALGLLRAGGFAPAEAPDICGYLVASVITLVATEPGARRGPDPDAHDAAVRTLRANLLSLPPQEFPNIISMADAITTCEDDAAYYAQGLDLLIAGVRGLRESLP